MNNEKFLEEIKKVDRNMVEKAKSSSRIEDNTDSNTPADKAANLPEDGATTPMEDDAEPKLGTISKNTGLGSRIRKRKSNESFKEKIDRLRSQLIVD